MAESLAAACELRAKARKHLHDNLPSAPETKVSQRSSAAHGADSPLGRETAKEEHSRFACETWTWTQMVEVVLTSRCVHFVMIVEDPIGC